MPSVYKVVFLFISFALTFKTSHWRGTLQVPTMFKVICPVMSVANTFANSYWGETIHLIKMYKIISLGLISSKIISIQVSATDPLIVKILLSILVSIQIFAHRTSTHPILFFKIIHILIRFFFNFSKIFLLLFRKWVWFPII